ncbi:hypothetical protein JOF53_005539 [Crossiella equi]|uniref:Uncharacterized protein n=1 Tax=Crossiella equi TaxID=130796 RepID=A0ABS5AJV6_9PSEU|nr:hypothetical protein [Crossiella equi]MBP2476667.1 hypothetical protein [Crossiella equi]
MGVGTETALPRARVLAECWSELGPAVAPLGNASGRPLARTEKLILDPLVLRPVHNPRFAGGTVRAEHVGELRAVLRAAKPALAATASWFTVLKKARRRLRITEGHPQDLYFQRCYELAVQLGEPGADAPGVAERVLAEVHEPAGPTVTALRDFVLANAPELAELLARTRPERARTAAGALGDFLATCADSPDLALFADLVTAGAGSHEDRPGAAHVYGLTDHEQPRPPELGRGASKQHLPKPLDRSILERLFAAFTSAFHREAMAEVPALVHQEIHRSAQPWQLGAEPSRVVLVLGHEATGALDGDTPAPPGAPARLRSRWQREAYVHRVSRLPQRVRADVHGIRQAYLRRLWVRLHGRELRTEEITAELVWDLLDGVLRSVVLDQRDALRTELSRGGGA